MMTGNPYSTDGVEKKFGCGCVAIMGIDHDGSEYVSGWEKGCKTHPRRDPSYRYIDEPVKPEPEDWQEKLREHGANLPKGE